MEEIIMKKIFFSMIILQSFFSISAMEADENFTTEYGVAKSPEFQDFLKKIQEVLKELDQLPNANPHKKNSKYFEEIIVKRQQNIKKEQDEYCKNYSDANHNQEKLVAIANLINLHFGKDYLGGSHKHTQKVNGKFLTVYRPNHGLSHGMRKAFLMGDLIDSLNQTTESSTLIDWVKDQLKNDGNFKEKAQLTAAYLRSGREDESGEGTWYEAGAIKDCCNFYFAARSLGFHQFKAKKEITFKDLKEIQNYAFSLLKSHQEKGNDWIKNMRRLGNIVHNLELLRMGASNYDHTINNMNFIAEPNAAKKNNGVYVGMPKSEIIQKIVYGLNSRARHYIMMCGDYRALTDNNIKTVSRNAFFTLENDPEKLVNALIFEQNFLDMSKTGSTENYLQISINQLEENNKINNANQYFNGNAGKSFENYWINTVLK